MEITKEKKMYLRIRNLCGILGVVLPWLALLSAGIAEHPSEEWWWSISATYYQSPALVGVLIPACLVLITYVGYDKLDNIITTLSGIFGLGKLGCWHTRRFFPVANPDIQHHPHGMCRFVLSPIGIQ